MTYSEAYEKALQLLNVRFLSEGELRTKLRRRDVRDDVIDEVMAMLKEEHFIDDDRLARQVYAYYVRKKQYGHLYIANCLRRRQLMVPDDIERLMNTPWQKILPSESFPAGTMKRGRRRDISNTAVFLPRSSPKSSLPLRLATRVDNRSK